MLIDIQIHHTDIGMLIDTQMNDTNIDRVIDITKKNFRLINFYFLYRVFRATYSALISKVTDIQINHTNQDRLKDIYINHTNIDILIDIQINHSNIDRLIDINNKTVEVKSFIEVRFVLGRNLHQTHILN